MKKILVSCALLIMMSGCNKMTMNTVVNEPNFAGVVTEVYDNSFLLLVNEGEDARRSSDLISVSLNAQLRDSYKDIRVGDEVRVYYNGEIAESYPAQVHTVYAIMLLGSAE